MIALTDRAFALGIHPTARGFGWAVLDGPFSAFDHGHFTAKEPNKNQRCLARLDRLIDEFSPEVLVLESFDKNNSKRSERVGDLGLAIVNLAADRGLSIAVYRKSDVQDAFAAAGARTREEIAEATLRNLPMLSPRRPEKPAPGDGEDKRMAIFSAAALVLTWYHFGSLGLMGDLARGA
jgi:Holliday junction resolvasome RuvABC endonuclease subunit